jgi:hypothetical protein
MSLLRNFSPGGSEPDDDEPLATAAQQDEGERPAASETGETATGETPSGGGHVPGTARYAFAGPSAGGAPAPATVVPSEVVSEPGDLAPDEPAPETAPVPVAETDDRGMTAPDRETPVAPHAPGPVFEPYAPESAAPATAPVPVPSPRAAGEGEPSAQPATAAEPDFAAPLLGDAAELRARWQRVQGDFVDDPRAAVSDAADLVGQTVETLMEALRQRQRQLRTLWERGGVDGSPAATGTSGGPDTEELRLMMQRYRALFNELCRPS